MTELLITLVLAAVLGAFAVIFVAFLVVMLSVVFDDRDNDADFFNLTDDDF